MNHTNTTANSNPVVFQNVAVLLTTLVLSTIPYTMEYLPEELLNKILHTLSAILTPSRGDGDHDCGVYTSAYQPGVGLMAILLKGEQLEEPIHATPDDDDDDDDEDDDDDDEEVTPVCADTLQDLLRTVKKVVQLYFQSNPPQSSSTNPNTNTPLVKHCTRFALISDAPWDLLSGKQEEYAPMEGDAEDEMMKRKEQNEKNNRLLYSGRNQGGLVIIFPPGFRLLPFLFGLHGGKLGGSGYLNGDFSGVDAGAAVALQCHSLDGIVFGRLNIFDAPPDDDDDDDDDDEDDDNHDGSSNVEKNPQMDSFVKTFSLIDRYFLSESVRDCLICHRSNVSDTGLEKGTSKDVAEQIWAVSHLFLPPKQNDDDNNNDNDEMTGDGTNPTINASKGIEYGIVETILSLIVQSPRGIDSTSPLSHIYLSRVLLDLTKHQPSLVPQSLAVAVSVLFQDCIPALVPAARENLSTWLAFHLTNTDYQWPHGYWNHWTPYVVKGMALKNGESNKENGGGTGFTTRNRMRNSRGEFVTNAIHSMTTYVSSPETIVTECLPIHSPLTNFLFFPGGNSGNSNSSETPLFSSALKSVENDLKERIWKNSDDPDTIREYMVGDEVSESVQSSMDEDMEEGSSSLYNPDKIWWRTGLVIRSLLHLASKESTRLERAIAKSRDVGSGMSDDGDSNPDTSNMMDLEDDGKEDVLTDVGDAILRYRPVILATVARDVQVHEENLDLRGETKKDEGDMLIMGEMYILRQFETVLFYSRTVFNSFIEILVKHQIVSGMAVLRWALGDNMKDGDGSNLVFGWWNFASLAIRVYITNILSGNGVESGGFGPDGDIGMIIDSGGDDGERD